jgi:hypothetical protein
MSTRRKVLFSPAVGSKASIKKYPIDDYRYYDVVVEPFAHAGPIAVDRLLKFGTTTGCRHAIVSDSDISIYSVWKAWLDLNIRKETNEIIQDYLPSFIVDDREQNLLDGLFPVRKQLNAAKKEIKKLKDKKQIIPDELTATLFSLKKEYDRINNLLKQEKSYLTYLELKKIFNASRHGDYHISQIAAISLLLRKLVFGSVIRCSNKGLNVTLSWDKLIAFHRWKPTWHQLDPMCKVELSTDYKIALDQLTLSSFKCPLVLIDPPYWLPYEPGSKRRGTGSMTQAYVVHNPWDDETYNMAVDSVERCLMLKVTTMPALRVVLTNYWSRPMQLAMNALSRKYGVPVHTTQIDVMTGMNKSRANTTNRIETAWEFGGNRMFYPKGFETVVQLEAA